MEDAIHSSVTLQKEDEMRNWREPVLPQEVIVRIKSDKKVCRAQHIGGTP